MAIATWQVVISFFVIGACMLIFEHGPDFHAAHAEGVIATVLSGVLGTGIAYGLWFSIITKLPATTASLGVLGSPVIGVISSVLILGERPDRSRCRRICADTGGVGLRAVHPRQTHRPARFTGRRLEPDQRATVLTDCANAATRATMALCGSASASMTVK